jgi:thiol:disulfide interchange protein DsbD
MKIWLYVLCFALSMATHTNSQAQQQLLGSANGQSSLILEQGNTFLPVEQVYQVDVDLQDEQLVFNWNIRPNHYLYRDRFKFNAVDATTQLKKPIFRQGKRKYDEFFEEELEVYYDTTTVIVPFQSATAVIDIQIESQGCADAGLCYPPYKQWISIDAVTGEVLISDKPSDAALAASPKSKDSNPLPLHWILAFALIGGVILNLMPCVFPVLSIKAMSFSRQHQTQVEKQAHGLAYTLGVVLSFVVIASIMLSLRAAGEAIGWGFQLQSPIFVTALIYLFFVMGLAFSGYLEIGTSLMSIGQTNGQQSQGLSSSFMTGVLATTVASPCTAPFMGPALGFAIGQPAYIALLVFAFLGLGMALPFILLAWVPGLSSKLPKPGAWMDNFKQFLAFPLYLTAVWLLWVVGRQTSIDVAAVIVAGVIFISLAIWLSKLRAKAGKKIIDAPWISLAAVILFLSALVAPLLTISNDREPPLWTAYSPEKLNQLRNNGQPVFINLTADWCITCLANERVAFTENFYQALADHNIVYLKGDWTNNDPEITELLNKFQRSGVPLYLLYPKGDGQPEVLPQILLENVVLQAIEKIKS